MKHWNNNVEGPESSGRTDGREDISFRHLWTKKLTIDLNINIIYC